MYTLICGCAVGKMENQQEQSISQNVANCDAQKSCCATTCKRKELVGSVPVDVQQPVHKKVKTDGTPSPQDGRSTGSKPLRKGTYQGEMVQGKAEGSGQWFAEDGKKYEGEWSNDKFEGKGTLVCPNGTTYVGQFKAGRYDGRGKLTQGNGSIYDGDFKEGHMEGKGQLTYPDGSVYQGSFQDGEREGSGTMKFPNGSVYVGKFKEDRPVHLSLMSSTRLSLQTMKRPFSNSTYSTRNLGCDYFDAFILVESKWHWRLLNLKLSEMLAKLLYQ
eukprot:g9027.t1